MAVPFDDGNFILFNGLYGAIDVIDQQTADIIRDAQQSDTAPRGLDEEMRERLIRRGHLIERQTEVDDLKILSRMTLHMHDQNYVSLIIMPTYNCNFRCTYCTERHRLTHGQAWLERVMSPKMIDAIFKQLKTYRAKGKKVKSCTLFGGEPLLASNIDTVRNICEHCREMEMPISAITNGYDLEHYLDLIEEFKFTFLQITLDGVGKMHDRRRPAIDGGSSYERVMKNVGLALDRGIKISLRINVDRQNINDLGSLIEEFKAHGFTDKPNFSYYCKAVLSGTSPNPADELTDIDVFEKLKELGFDEREAINLDSVHHSCQRSLKDILNQKRYPPLRASHCGAEGGMCVLDASGNIYTCWDMVGKEYQTVGQVDEARGRFNFDLDIVKWRTRRVHNIEPCRYCAYVMQCGGGCASLAYNHYGTIMKGNCDVFKDAFDHVLPIACREAWSEAQSPEMSRSWRELLSKFSDSERQTLLKTINPQQTLDIWKKHTTVKDLIGGGDYEGLGIDRRGQDSRQI